MGATLDAADMVAATTGTGELALNASNFLRTGIVAIGRSYDLTVRRLQHQLVPRKAHRASASIF